MEHKAANQNLLEVAPGHSYYPEMGERAPSAAIVEASLGHYGRHYYVKFATSNRGRVIGAIKDMGLRFSHEDTFTSATTGESKTTVQMTCGAYDKFRRAHPALCTMQILLD